MDEPALTCGTYLEENLSVKLEAELAEFEAAGIDLTVSSCYRLAQQTTRSFQLERHTPRKGREAPVVFFVLGSDPAAPGAKRWAAATVNLENVAAVDLCTIGDRASWEQNRYFREIAAFLGDGAKGFPTI